MNHDTPHNNALLQSAGINLTVKELFQKIEQIEPYELTEQDINTQDHAPYGYEAAKRLLSFKPSTVIPVPVSSQRLEELWNRIANRLGNPDFNSYYSKTQVLDSSSIARGEIEPSFLDELPLFPDADVPEESRQVKMNDFQNLSVDSIPRIGLIKEELWDKYKDLKGFPVQTLKLNLDDNFHFFPGGVMLGELLPQDLQGPKESKVESFASELRFAKLLIEIIPLFVIYLPEKVKYSYYEQTGKISYQLILPLSPTDLSQRPLILINDTVNKEQRLAIYPPHMSLSPQEEEKGKTIPHLSDPTIYLQTQDITRIRPEEGKLTNKHDLYYLLQSAVTMLTQ
ncbi:MAG: hypothetical protein AAFO96_03485 [Bacteroidota bacterium]